MRILEVSVLPFGRFEVHDDWSIVDVLLYPDTTDLEIARMEEVLGMKAGIGATPKEVFTSAMATLGVPMNWVEFHYALDEVLMLEPNPLTL